MKKKIFIFVMVALLLLCSVSSVFAHSSIKMYFNGKEVFSDVSPKVVNGRLLVPIRIITERLGALIKWNEKHNSVEINFEELQAQKTRISLLESALAPKDPDAAVKTWAEGVKTRNGALQYAVMTPELKEESYSDFVKMNWSTGTSSPWIKSFEVYERSKVNGETYRYEVVFTYTDSTKKTFTDTQYVTVVNCEGNWLVSSLDKFDVKERIDIKGEITRVTLDRNKKVKSIFVEDDKAERKGYDKANVLIGSDTIIYDGYTDQKLRDSVLKKGVEVEVTFTDDPVAMIYPVTAEAKIIRVIDEPQDNSIVYRNTRYGFSFSLPKSWEGYTIVTDQWEGISLERAKSGRVVERGPILSIRHPKWTSKNPRQDIPIMIFTLEQWKSLQQGKFSVGAAPVGPTELDRNSKYVFALPARYNYAFPTGYEEVERILEGNPLVPFENK
ncbi:MAG: stalk domain-containing protein [Dethiobacteria bacterium]